MDAFRGIFWLVFIGALVYLFSSAFGSRHGTPRDRGETPLEVAKRRLAAGEISHDDYERLRETLTT